MSRQVAEEVKTDEWTCERCEVTVSWTADGDAPKFPATWSEKRGRLYCLACRRDLAAEAGLLKAGDDLSQDEKKQIMSRARIEFELKRNPRREDNRIASACKTSLDAVKKARVRLGMTSQGS